MSLSPMERVELSNLAGENVLPVDIEEMLALDALGSLSAFCQQFFSINDPGIKLEWAWFHDVICHELEHVTNEFDQGRPARLVICIPPGCMKSIIVSVLWPSWWWLRAPQRRFLTLANKEELSMRDSRRMRDVVTSAWYQQIVRILAKHGVIKRVWGLSRDQRKIKNFQNTARGGRQTFSMTSGVTGFRGDGRIVDDPHQVDDVLGTPESVEKALRKAHRFCDVVLPSRNFDYRKAFEVVVQQRVHEQDVAGRRLASDRPYQRKVVFAAEFDPDAPHNHPMDPRTEKGQLLDPDRMPESVLNELMAEMEGEYPGQGQAQYNQAPQPADGGMFPKTWTEQRYFFDFQRPPKPFTEKVVTIDCTFKRSQKADFVSMQAWGRLGWELYLGDERHDRMSFTELCDAAEEFIMMHRPRFVLVEAKANGEALIDYLKKTMSVPVEGFLPDRWGDKVSRAAGVTVFWRAGNVWLPSKTIAPWIDEYIYELCGFPASLHDDRVDAMSQLLITWQELSLKAGHDAQAHALDTIVARALGKPPPDVPTTPQKRKSFKERQRDRLRNRMNGG